MSARTILYVDDELSALKTFRFMLGKEFEVLTAQTVEEGLQILRGKEIPVVIADYKMGPVDGIEFLRQAKEIAPETIRIMLTAHTTSEVLLQAINKAHAYGFMQKPIEAHGRESLLLSLNQWIGVYDLRFELKRKNEQLEGAYRKISDQNDELMKKSAQLEEYSRHLEKLVEGRTRQLFEEQKYAFIGRMMNHLAHDLKGPYYSFRSLREMLMDRWKQLEGAIEVAGKEVYQDMGELLEAGGHALEVMGYLVEGLHSYGRNVGKIEEMDIPQGIEKVLGLLKASWRGKIEVKREYASSVPKIQGRGGEVVRIWSNLLGNAGFAVMGSEKRRGGKGEIRVRIQSQGKEGRPGVEVRIRDNGPGIPLELKDSLFDPFMTTKSEGEGSGLGLAIAKSVVESHGGMIDVNSEFGAWTEFRVWLPVEGPPLKGDGL